MSEEEIKEESVEPIIAERVIPEETPEEKKKRLGRERMAKARAGRGKKKPVILSEVPVEANGTAPAIHIDHRSKGERIQFFTEHDIDSNGHIKNAYPTYYNSKQRDDIEYEISMLEAGIKGGHYNSASEGIAREKLKKAKEALDKMNEVRPLFEKEKDSIAALTRDAGQRISESMFSREEEKRGLTDAHELARRWTDPCIPVSDQIAEVATRHGMVVKDKKMNQVDLTRLWQMGQEALGENRDAEYLRRDMRYGR
jgi:hypothetical protein